MWSAFAFCFPLVLVVALLHGAVTGVLAATCTLLQALVAAPLAAVKLSSTVILDSKFGPFLKLYGLVLGVTLLVLIPVGTFIAVLVGVFCRNAVNAYLRPARATVETVRVRVLERPHVYCICQ
jgi:hypothetical protein